MTIRILSRASRRPVGASGPSLPRELLGRRQALVTVSQAPAAIVSLPPVDPDPPVGGIFDDTFDATFG